MVYNGEDMIDASGSSDLERRAGMGDYGSAEHAYEVFDDDGVESEVDLGSADPTTAARGELDLMEGASNLLAADERWTPSGRIPNEWNSREGARLRLSYMLGETCATVLPRGWERMATWQRALATTRCRLRDVGDIPEFVVLLDLFGRLGRLPGERVTAVTESPAEAMVAEGRTGLPVAPARVLTTDGAADSGMLPTQAHQTDAAYDLYTVGEWRIPPGAWVDVPCGIRVQLPDHTWGMIIGRSSTLRRRGLLVQISVIDPGYRGPLFVQAYNMREGQEVAIRDKERIGQLVILPNLSQLFQPVWVEELSQSDRGESGFGSSGT